MVSLSNQLIALRRLSNTSQTLQLLDKRLSTGVKVADTRDSTAATSGARASASRTTSFSAVQNSLDRGIATVSTAATAAATAGGILGNIRDLLTAAKDGNADLKTLQTMLVEQQMKLRSTVTGAAFKNVNLLASSTATSSYLGAPTDAAGAAYSIAVDRSRTRLLDTVGTSGILQRTFGLAGAASAAPSTLGLAGAGASVAGVGATPTTNGLSGTASSVAGLAANPPAATGLSGTANAVDGAAGITPARTGLHGTPTSVVTGAAGTASTAAKAIIGTFNPSSTGLRSGDTIQLTMTVNGIANGADVYMRTVENAATLKTELQRAVDAAYGVGVLVADVAADNTISLQTVTTGSGASVNVTGVTVVDGDAVTTSKLDLVAQSTYSTTTKTINGATHVYDSLAGLNLSGLDKTDRLRFKYDVRDNTGYAYSHTITVKLATVTDGASLAAAINQAIVDDTSAAYSYYAGVTFDGANILFYQKADDSGIRVTQITAINGNGTIAANFGLTTGSASGTSGATGTAASFVTGTDFSEPVTLGTGAYLDFSFSVNGAATPVRITKSTVETALAGQAGYAAGSGTIADIGKFALVVQQAVGDAGIANVSVAAAGSRLKFTKTGTPAGGDTLSMSSVNTRASTATAATLTTGSDFVGPRTIASNASLDFTLTVDGAATNVSITKNDVEQALNGRGGYTSGSGTISSATELALAARAAMTRQNISNVTVAASGNRLVFTKTPAGTGTLAISNVAGNSAATNAVATAGSAFTSAITVADGAAITFDVALDGGAVRTVRIEKSTVETALGGVAGRTAGTGTINSAAEFALVAQRALADAGVSGITVGTSGGALTFTRTAAGVGSVAINNVLGVAAGAPATGGLSGTASLVSGSTAAARGAVATLNIPAQPEKYTPGDTFELVTTVNGATRTAKISSELMRDTVSVATREAALQSALDAQYGANVVRLRFSNAQNATLETVATGVNQSVAVNAVRIVDGDMRTTSTLGLETDWAFHWVNNSSVAGQARSSSIQRNANVSGIDTNDRIRLRIESRNAGTYSSPDGRYAANGAIQSYEVTVSLAGVTDKASLAAAIDAAFANDAAARDVFGAAMGFDDGNNPQMLIYHKVYGSSIRVAEVAAVNYGDGVAGGAYAFTTTSTAGAAAGAAASATTGSDFAGPVTLDAGETLKFDLTVNGAVKTVTIDKATVDNALAGQAGYVAGSGTIANINQLALVAQRALADGSVSGVAVAAAGNRLQFTMTTPRANGDSINVSNVQAAVGPATAASLITGSDFSGPLTIDAGATIGFDVALDGGAARRVTIGQSTVEAALSGVAGRTSGSGVIANVSEFALVVQRALTEAGVSNVAVSVEGNRLKLAKTATGAGQVAIGNVTSTGASALGSSSATTIDSINLNGAAVADLGLAQRQRLLDDYRLNVEAIAQRVARAASYLDFVGRQMEIQSKHTTKLQGVEASRVSKLVNADLDSDGARRAALETRLALVRQSMEIVNQSRKNVLNIF